METNISYRIDCSQSNRGYDHLFDQIHQQLYQFDFVIVKCENIGNNQYDQVCLNIIESIGGKGSPYGKDPDAFVWPVKVIALDSDPQSANFPGTNVDRELHFHTDCSYEENAPDYIGFICCSI